MRAVVVTEFGGPEAVEIAEVEVPEPGPGRYGSRSRPPRSIRSTPGCARAASGARGGGSGLGWDVAGTVDAAGTDAGWRVGDEVVALSYGAVKSLGTHADYVVVDADAVAGAPSSVDPVHAASLPLNALTAAQALDLLALEPGQSLAVTGAAGAVGGYAVNSPPTGVSW